MHGFLPQAARPLTHTLLYQTEQREPGQAGNRLTLANVCLGEAANGASNRDLLWVVRLCHLQVSCARVFLHDEYNLTVI